MDSLGNNTFYIVIIVIFICLLAIAIANSIYFTDIYNTGSENLTSTQSQQLSILNIILVPLCFIGIIMISYMIYSPYEKSIQNDNLIEIMKEKNREYDLKIIEVDSIVNNIDKRKKMKEEMHKIVKKMEIPLKRLQQKNKSLKNDLGKISNELKELKENVGDLYDKDGNLIKTDEQLVAELEKHKLLIDDVDVDSKIIDSLKIAKESKDSIFYQGITDDDILVSLDNNTTTDTYDNTYNINELYPERSSLTDILDEIPRSSILSNPNKEKEYNYGINSKSNIIQDRKNSSVYIPFSQRDKDTIDWDSTKLNQKSLSSKSKYKPYNFSLLSQLQSGRN